MIAEVAYIMTAKKHFGLPVEEVAQRLTTVLHSRGMKHSEKRVYLTALEVWQQRPALGFVDALTTSYARSPGMQLATFDSDFDGVPGIVRWQPPN